MQRTGDQIVSRIAVGLTMLALVITVAVLFIRTESFEHKYRAALYQNVVLQAQNHRQADLAAQLAAIDNTKTQLFLTALDDASSALKQLERKTSK